MLAVFHKDIVQGPPQLSSGDSSTTQEDVVRKYEELYPAAVSLNFDKFTSLRYSHDKEQLAYPRQFAATESVFCFFIGNLENLSQLRQIYGLAKNITEVHLVLEAYRVLRDRGPYSADQVVAELKGTFSFVIYDYKRGNTFAAVDPVGKLKFYWGITSDGALAITDCPEVLKAGCGKSFAPFPKGCLFTSQSGLHSYMHPDKTLKAVPHVDSEGQICGANFRVDSQQDLAGQINEHGKDWLNSF